MPPERIGFIGTGIMGLPMAENLLKAGYSLTVHTRTISKARPLISQGARWADCPADTAENSDFLITCLPDTPDVDEVLLGPKGVIRAAKSVRWAENLLDASGFILKKSIICCAVTANPAFADSLKNRLTFSQALWLTS